MMNFYFTLHRTHVLQSGPRNKNFLIHGVRSAYLCALTYESSDFYSKQTFFIKNERDKEKKHFFVFEKIPRLEKKK